MFPLPATPALPLKSEQTHTHTTKVIHCCLTQCLHTQTTPIDHFFVFSMRSIIYLSLQCFRHIFIQEACVSCTHATICAGVAGVACAGVEFCFVPSWTSQLTCPFSVPAIQDHLCPVYSRGPIYSASCVHNNRLFNHSASTSCGWICLCSLRSRHTGVHSHSATWTDPGSAPYHRSELPHSYKKSLTRPADIFKCRPSHTVGGK